jgi:hypothetical protein
MQALKVREKLIELSDTYAIISKINAVLQATKAFIVGSERGSTHVHETTNEYEAYMLEAERMKAKAEEFAQNLRQGFM